MSDIEKQKTAAEGISKEEAKKAEPIKEEKQEPKIKEEKPKAETVKEQGAGQEEKTENKPIAGETEKVEAEKTAKKVEEMKKEETAQPKDAPENLKFILGRKVGMTQVFDEKGNLYAVSVVEAGPCNITRVRTQEKDGYKAVCLGFGEQEEKKINKPDLGYFKKHNINPVKHQKEYRVEDLSGIEIGQVVKVNTFKEGDIVDIQGKTKGKGFAGVMKRHGFSGLPATHGTKTKGRSPGSIGSRRSLGRVIPGQKMPGRMGQNTKTMQRIEVVKVDAENNLIYLNGSVPGAKGTIISILETSKKKSSDTLKNNQQQKKK